MLDRKNTLTIPAKVKLAESSGKPEVYLNAISSSGFLASVRGSM